MKRFILLCSRCNRAFPFYAERVSRTKRDNAVCGFCQELDALAEKSKRWRQRKGAA